MNAVTTIEESPASLPVPQAATPSHLLALAVQQGADMAKLQQLMDLQERWEKNEARKAYVAAMARFKAQPIIVEKDRTVDFTSAKGRTHYKHASLASVVDAVVSRMGQFGLSHKWVTAQADGVVTVTCVITHELGHSESVELCGPRDDSGNKNSLQQIASTITYLQRYTLMSLCGLASKDVDDDGARSSGPTEPALITEKQLADLEAKISEVGADRVGFLKFLRVEALGDLRADRYNDALQALKEKASGARKGGAK